MHRGRSTARKGGETEDRIQFCVTMNYRARAGERRGEIHKIRALISPGPRWPRSCLAHRRVTNRYLPAPGKARWFGDRRVSDGGVGRRGREASASRSANGPLPRWSPVNISPFLLCPSIKLVYGVFIYARPGVHVARERVEITRDDAATRGAASRGARTPLEKQQRQRDLVIFSIPSPSPAGLPVAVTQRQTRPFL